MITFAIIKIKKKGIVMVYFKLKSYVIKSDPILSTKIEIETVRPI